MSDLDRGTWAERRQILNNALAYDGGQAWTHYRHLESQRNQYMGFLFTAVLGVAGLLVALIAKGNVDRGLLLLGAALLAFVLQLLCFLLYTAVRKIGAALQFHHQELDAVRYELFKGFEEDSGDFGSRPYAKYRVSPLLKTKIYSTQGSSELTILVLSGSLWVGQTSAGIYAMFLASGSGIWRVGVTVLAIVSIALLVTYAAFHHRVTKQAARVA